MRELIDRYQPSVLWNDICWPGGGNLAELVRPLPQHRDRRGRQRSMAGSRGRPTRGRGRACPRTRKCDPGDVALHPGEREVADVSGGPPLRLPNTRSTRSSIIVTRKWESTRGVGHSFGANRNERPEDIVTTTELVRSFQRHRLEERQPPHRHRPGARRPDRRPTGRPLRGLGSWLAVNGRPSGSRPWDVAATETTEGTEVRFTRSGDEVYAILLDLPGSRTFGLRGVDASAVSDVRLLGVDEAIAWNVSGRDLTVTLPERVPVAAAYVLSLGRGARAITTETRRPLPPKERPGSHRPWAPWGCISATGPVLACTGIVGFTPARFAWVWIASPGRRFAGRPGEMTGSGGRRGPPMARGQHRCGQRLVDDGLVGAPAAECWDRPRQVPLPIS